MLTNRAKRVVAVAVFLCGCGRIGYDDVAVVHPDDPTPDAGMGTIADGMIVDPEGDTAALPDAIEITPDAVIADPDTAVAPDTGFAPDTAVTSDTGTPDGNFCTVSRGGKELCDGVDNDCKPGTADGVDEPTFGDSCDGDDSDLCTEGTQSSCDGVNMVCSDTSTGTTEIPSNVATCNDAIDNDCDGTTDSGDPGCALPGTIGVDAANASLSTAAGGPSISWNHTTGAGNNRFLVVACNINRTSTQAITGVTYGGVNLVLIHAVTNPGGRRTEQWKLLAPAVGSHTIIVRVSPNAAFGCGSVTFTGINQSVPHATPVASIGRGVPPPVVLNVPSAPGSLVLDFIGYGGGIRGAGPAQTQLWQQDNRSRIQGSASTAPGAASVAMSWVLQETNATWCIQAISLNPAP